MTITRKILERRMGLRCTISYGGVLYYQISIDLPQTFRVGYFLESLIVRQERAVELLKNLCADVSTDRTWANKGLHTKNILVVELEVQRLENFPEWQERPRVALDQVGWAERALE